MTRADFDTKMQAYGIDPYLFEVNDGWLDLLDRLVAKLVALGWDKKINQVKEKFGGLRFYINPSVYTVHTAISDAEAESFYICEYCGQPGGARKRRGGYWIKTTCNACWLSR